ncbi:unnamed protein product [Eruca vesicaria subsp. sativa]|uniref:Uncharacterized protein n=1 Tax=Eruca vesicaria subsp. sativa TaxID=29727 RepID=A0ABC8KY76_ERUVS|nr:unnamed protein product [Eruca vesicaria subsp. sativa]
MVCFRGLALVGVPEKEITVVSILLQGSSHTELNVSGVEVGVAPLDKEETRLGSVKASLEETEIRVHHRPYMCTKRRGRVSNG